MTPTAKFTGGSQADTEVYNTYSLTPLKGLYCIFFNIYIYIYLTTFVIHFVNTTARGLPDQQNDNAEDLYTLIEQSQDL